MNEIAYSEGINGHTIATCKIDGRIHKVHMWLITGGTPAIAMTGTNGTSHWFNTKRFPATNHKHVIDYFNEEGEHHIIDFVKANYEHFFVDSLLAYVYNTIRWQSKRIHDEEDCTYFKFAMGGEHMLNGYYLGVQNNHRYRSVSPNSFKHELGDDAVDALLTLDEIRRDFRLTGLVPTIADVRKAVEARKVLTGEKHVLFPFVDDNGKNGSLLLEEWMEKESPTRLWERFGNVI